MNHAKKYLLQVILNPVIHIYTSVPKGIPLIKNKQGWWTRLSTWSNYSTWKKKSYVSTVNHLRMNIFKNNVLWNVTSWKRSCWLKCITMTFQNEIIPWVHINRNVHKLYKVNHSYETFIWMKLSNFSIFHKRESVQ